ncbi:MAG: hypothetical protein FJ356_02020 [Thaumarchaeota archaeon]|nr:hypothetical protein [Nitrososphaerota archaeon]
MRIRWQGIPVGFFIIILLFSQLSNVTAQTPDYEWTYKYYDYNPFFCIIKNSYYKEYGWYLYMGIKDWETKLHASVSTEQQRANWNIDVSFVDQKYDWCDVMVYTVSSQSYTCHNEGEGIPAGCAHGSYAIYLYMDILMNDSKDTFRSTVRHEAGHVFGLGHYSSQDERQNKAWREYAHSPSIMVPILHYQPAMQDITDLDIATLKEIYGEGFSKPAPPPPKEDPPPYIHEKKIHTSEQIGMVTLSIIKDERILGKAITVQEGNVIQLGGKVRDYYGNGISGVYVYVDNFSAVSDNNGDFVIDFTAKHNQKNMGINKSTWKFVAKIPVQYGMVESEPVSVFVEKSQTKDLKAKSDELKPKITLVPSINGNKFGGSGFVVAEDTLVNFKGQIVNNIGKPVPQVPVSIADKANPHLRLLTTTTDYLGNFKLDWSAIHNDKKENDRSVWNLFAVTNSLYERIESNVVTISVQSSNEDALIQETEYKEKSTLALMIYEEKFGKLKSEINQVTKSLNEAKYDNPEASKKINEAMKVRDMALNKLNIIREKLDNGKSLFDNDEFKSAYEILDTIDADEKSIKKDLEWVYKNIKEAKEITKSKTCILIFCW